MVDTLDDLPNFDKPGDEFQAMMENRLNHGNRSVGIPPEGALRPGSNKKSLALRL
jgi:hypothetical protein